MKWVNEISSVKMSLIFHYEWRNYIHKEIRENHVEHENKIKGIWKIRIIDNECESNN